MKKRIGVGLVILVLTLLVTTTALAAWGGEFDGNRHPMVTCPPKTGPGRVLGLDPIGGTIDGKTERLFYGTGHFEVA